MPAERPLRDRREAGFHLIETMRREPAGIVRIALHLARLERSAHALDIPFARETAEHELSAFPETAAPQRIRLALYEDGRCMIEVFPFTPIAEGAVWKLAIASTRLASTDPLLRYKTSRRAVYETARAEFAPAEADEVLLLNENDEVCEGSITTLYVDTGEGPLLTPPLECGLLASVLRAEMLTNGKARETVLHLDDLTNASGLFVGNSLRGLIPATLTLRADG